MEIDPEQDPSTGGRNSRDVAAERARGGAFLPQVRDPASIEGLRLILSWGLVGAGREWSRLLDDRLRIEGQTRPRWRVLAWARLMPGITQTELAERMSISGAALVGILDGLVKLGLVERRTSVQDRRVNEIHLTDAAQPVIGRITAEVARIRDHILQDISEDELRSFVSVLDRIRTRLKQP